MHLLADCSDHKGLALGRERKRTQSTSGESSLSLGSWRRTDWAGEDLRKICHRSQHVHYWTRSLTAVSLDQERGRSQVFGFSCTLKALRSERNRWAENSSYH
jgi:hypothetical protein